MFLDYAHTPTYTCGRTPLNEWSALRRERYIHTTQQIEQTNIHAPSRIRTRDPSNQVASDLRLRPHGHRDRLAKLYMLYSTSFEQLRSLNYDRFSSRQAETGNFWQFILHELQHYLKFLMICLFEFNDTKRSSLHCKQFFFLVARVIITCVDYSFCCTMWGR
jgi:hypothetical protein